jgi:hypothetical protein
MTYWETDKRSFDLGERNGRKKLAREILDEWEEIKLFLEGIYPEFCGWLEKEANKLDD